MLAIRARAGGNTLKTSRVAFRTRSRTIAQTSLFRFRSDLSCLVRIGPLVLPHWRPHGERRPGTRSRQEVSLCCQDYKNLSGSEASATAEPIRSSKPNGAPEFRSTASRLQGQSFGFQNEDFSLKNCTPFFENIHPSTSYSVRKGRAKNTNPRNPLAKAYFPLPTNRAGLFPVVHYLNQKVVSHGCGVLVRFEFALQGR
jgi:hypothetical protein